MLCTMGCGIPFITVLGLLALRVRERLSESLGGGPPSALLLFWICSFGSLAEAWCQVSLQAYKKLFNQTMERTERSNDVAQRIELLIGSITLASYVVPAAGLGVAATSVAKGMKPALPIRSCFCP